MKSKTTVSILAMLVSLAYIAAGCVGSGAPSSLTEKLQTIPPEQSEPAAPEQLVQESSPAPEQEELTEPESANYKIALLTMDFIDQYWLTMNEGAQKAAAESGN
jgi:ribose transport system substrate-binding protein